MPVTKQGKKTKAGIVNFNPNTGSKLSQGQSVTVKTGGNTGSKLSQGKSVTVKTGGNTYGSNVSRRYDSKNVSRGAQSITSANLASSNPIQLPTKKVGENQMGTLIGNNQGLANPSMGLITNPTGGLEFTPPQVEKGATTNPATSNFQSYLNSIQGLQNNKPRATDTFNRLERQSGLKQAESEVQNYTAQLNTITSTAQAQALSLEGQGRGQTGSFVGGEQARISREAAIQALPIQAQLANAQDNKELAQTHLDTMFKLQMQDAQSQYDYQTKVLGAVYEFATTQEKARLDEMKQEKANEFTLKQDEASFTRDKFLKQMGIDADMAMFNAKQKAESSPLYGVSEKTVAKIQSSPENKTINGILPALQALTAYRDAINKHGTGAVFSGTAKGELSGTYGNALSAWKTLAGLGALSGADFVLAENAVPEIGVLKRNSTSIAKINSSIDIAVNQADSLTRRLSNSYPGASPLLEKQLDDMKVIAYPDKFTRGPDGLVYEIIK